MSNWYEQGGTAFKPPEIVKREKQKVQATQAKKAAKMSAVRSKFLSLQKLYKELFPDEEWSWELINVEKKVTAELLKRQRGQ